MAPRTASTAWLLRSGAVVESYATGARHQPPAVVERRDFWSRPPVGPPLAGRQATAGGRSHRRSQRAAAKERRRALALRAWSMRRGGATIRGIAAALGVSRTVVGRRLHGVYPDRLPARNLPRSVPVAFLWSEVEYVELAYDPDRPTRWPGGR